MEETNCQETESYQEPQVGTPMPKYKCHKEVYALKIEKVVLDSDLAREEGRETTGGATITPIEYPYAPFTVNEEYVCKHKPEAGGYYVVYEDGYKSFSPSSVFESGYTRI